VDDEDDRSKSSGAYKLESGTETYPLELAIWRTKAVEDLPPPLITPEGLLVYKFQSYLVINNAQFMVGEISMPYQGHYNLLENSGEVEKPIEIGLQVVHKRGILSRKKCADVYLHSETSGYLPGEIIYFTVENKNGDGLRLKWSVELVQKLWYQDPSQRQSDRVQKMGRRYSVKMKEILVVGAEKQWVEGEQVEMIWKGKLRVPKGQTPSYKHDFLNSISYILRLTVGIVGGNEIEGNGKVAGDSPVYIGTGRGDGNEGEVEPEPLTCGGGDDSDVDSNDSGTEMVMGMPMMCSSKSMSAIYSRTSTASAASTAVGHGRRRKESTSSMSSTRSAFWMPPSFSQLLSRRTKLETCELNIVMKFCTEFGNLDISFNFLLVNFSAASLFRVGAKFTRGCK